MWNHRRKTLTAIVAFVLSTTCGLLVGSFFGHSLAISRTKAKLVDRAEVILAKGEASSAESRETLANLNALSFTPCSSAELTYFRLLILRSQYLKEFGRVQDNRIICTASMGVLSRPFELPRSNFSQRDHTEVYRDLALFPNGPLPVVSLRQGRALVVFSPFTLADLDPSPMQYAVTVTDVPTKRAGHLLGEASNTKGMVLEDNSEGQATDSLFATRCSARYFNCVTAYITVSEAVHMGRFGMRMCMSLGGLIGALGGLSCWTAYLHNSGMAQQLRRAICREKLRVVYQPVVDIRTGRIVGAEALVRWTDEHGFDISPEIFIPLAEQVALVGAITELVVRIALREMGETMSANPTFRLALNAAAADLSDTNFVPMLVRTLALAGVAHASLAIELTERSTAAPVAAAESIRALRALGHRVYIDDFGTGYSSLAYLKDLAVDAIKIDKSFVQAIGTEAVTLAILPQVLAMAEGLKLDVIVEGIETQQQVDYFARDCRPICAQGWYYGRPVDSEEFLQLLRNNWQKRDSGRLERSEIIATCADDGSLKCESSTNTG